MAPKKSKPFNPETSYTLNNPEPRFTDEIRKIGRTRGGDLYYKWNGSEWTKMTGSGSWFRSMREVIAEYKKQQESIAAGAEAAELEAEAKRFREFKKGKAGLIPEASVTTGTAGALRYPSAKTQTITDSHDYVTFQFYNYQPPFKNRKTTNVLIDSEGASTITGKKKFASNLYDYNQTGAGGDSNQYVPKPNTPAIVLYMPEDVSTGFRSNWTGKAFGNFASGVLRTAAAEGIGDKLKSASNTAGNAFDRLIPVAGSQALRKLVSKVGGDQISNDDIFGGISGAILNPNVELMYGGGDLRNFSLNYKLVPRDGDEAKQINEICDQFKRAMLPKLDPGNVFGGTSAGTFAGFIGVPDLCRVAFMHGTKEHAALPRFKMCAITQVDVNYTPDGTYATYRDGQPVAIQLTVSFQETKMVFSEEIGGIR